MKQRATQVTSTFVLLLVGASLLGAFQNCSQAKFATAYDNLTSTGLEANAETIYTELNTPKTFTANFKTNISGLSLSIVGSSTLESGSTLTISNAGARTLTYTPVNGFRGTDTAVVRLSDNYGHVIDDALTLVVDNPFHDLQPAMATRTSGCISCHARVASSYITDFGAGDRYFFGKSVMAYGGNPLNGGGDSMYADRYTGEISLMSAQFKSQIILPDVALGFDLSAQIDAIINAGGVTAQLVPAARAISAQSKPTNTIADYMRTLETQKNGAYYATTSDAANILVKSSVYIGAPSVARMKAATEIGSARMAFYENSSTSPALSGVVDRSSYFELKSVTCDGDLVLNGTVYLNNLSLTTDTGCRIYATGSVFIEGPITYKQIHPSPTDLTNLQITSASWINFGVGLSHCETNQNPGWYVSNPGQTPTNMRLKVYGAPMRSTPDSNAVQALSDSWINEQSKVTGFIDASCRAGANPRAVSYSRLFVNAPRIDSRYTGQFTGVIVSEIAMFGLSTFDFTYDPVFNKVPVLPFLDVKDFLSVQ